MAKQGFHYFRHGHLPIYEDDCSYVWNIPVKKRCEWVRTTKDCSSDSLIQYAQLLFCTFGTENIPMFILGLTIIIAWLLYLFVILGSTADNFFCPSLATIAAVMRLSDNIAGVTILAFGNGAPDIFTSLVSGGTESIIMLTELIGAGVFVTSVIAGSVAVIRPFRVHLKPLMRDTCFYIIAVGWISYVIQDEKVYLWEAISLILIYVLFIVAVVLMQIYDSRETNLKSRIPSVSDPDVLRTYLANQDTIAIPRIPTRTRSFGLRTKIDVAIAAELQGSHVRREDAETTKGPTDRPKGLVKEFLYDVNPISRDDWNEADHLVKFILIIRSPFMFLLQLFIPVVNITAPKKGWSKLLNCSQLCLTPILALFLLNVWRRTIGPVPILPLFLVVGAVIGVIVFLTSHVDRVPKFHSVFAFLGFLAAMLIVYLVAGEVVSVLQCIGFACSISDAMLGITFLAVGNSVGDLISNITIARQGFPRMGYAACFGGPMFNTLLGLGLTYGVAAASSPDHAVKIRISDMAPGCIAFLLCSLLISIIYLNATGAFARRSYGYLLYSIYFIFLLFQFLSELHVIHPLGTDHRSDEHDKHNPFI
ncbi:mitochondrial sodium/calcium exchanger protein-like [Prorops nasuta]|uniref:mitochondrial sodium/calcium exchanger protein-like n=1 Tax=Prorops nasuta TaxID=863751 RepID=UPI0034CFCB24